jgi:hypothetical protein
MMQSEDTKTLNAFMTAAMRLQHPLPEEMQSKLDKIVEDFPDSIYQLDDLAEKYEPLKQEYLAVLREMPREGERLKLAEKVQPEEIILQEPTLGWDEVERRLGHNFLDMVLDMIERSHPEYDTKMAEVLKEGLEVLNSGNCTVLKTKQDRDDWLDRVFDSLDDEDDEEV